MRFEEYLEIEMTSEIRHEFVGGVMHAMSGASRRHNELTLAIAAALLPDAKAHGCRLYVSDMKLRVGNVSYYPDVMAACAGGMDSEYWETQPCLLVEVLSPSTRRIDQREKLQAYTALPSLEMYLIVDPETEDVTIHSRAVEGRWVARVAGLADDIAVPCVDGLLVLSSIFGA
jgi:Uma2 family endonuclease